MKYLNQAKQIIDQNRINAERASHKNLEVLNNHPRWKTLQAQIRKVRVDIGFSKNQSEQTMLRIQLSSLLTQQHHFLKTLGLKENDLIPNYKCKICNDTGYVESKRCKCLTKELHNLLFANSNISNRDFTFANSTETNEHNQKIYLVCEEICNSIETTKYKNIVLLGKTGMGKTYLCSAIANCLIEKDKEVLFTTAYNLNQHFLECHVSDINRKQQYLSNIIGVDVLIIDDLGTEPIYKNVSLEYLFAVLNERKQQQKITIYSTNLTPEQIRDRYEERIFSRMFDKSDTFTAIMQSTDKRTMQ